MERFPDILKREIFEPVTVDGSGWSGHDLCWSSHWFPGLYVRRALFIRDSPAFRTSWIPAMNAEDYGYENPDDWRRFAYAHDRAIAWCCSREGKIRGFGREGITYGPNVSVGEWFSDQVVDLRWARKQGDTYAEILGL